MDKEKTKQDSQQIEDVQKETLLKKMLHQKVIVRYYGRFFQF